eukprot:symbB.v1.2.034381.t1/scaffold4427.1/size39785/4
MFHAIFMAKCAAEDSAAGVVTNLTDSNFEAFIARGEGTPWAVKFYAPWCPKKKGEKKKPKFIRVGESLYRVQNYRLAYRRIFGKDIPMQEQYDFAHRQQHAVEATKARNKSKAASSPPFSRMPDAIIYPYERKK